LSLSKYVKYIYLEHVCSLPVSNRDEAIIPDISYQRVVWDKPIISDFSFTYLILTVFRTLRTFASEDICRMWNKTLYFTGFICPSPIFYSEYLSYTETHVLLYIKIRYLPDKACFSILKPIFIYTMNIHMASWIYHRIKDLYDIRDAHFKVNHTE